MTDNAGVVLGKLFLSSPLSVDAFAEPKFDAEKTKTAVKTCGRYLVENCWGSYVAFIRDAGYQNTHIIRAPVGRLPCFFLTSGGVKIFFSRTEDCVQLGVVEFTADLSYLLRHIVSRGSMLLSGTGLKQVSQIFPGECVTVSDAGERRATYWDPISIAQSNIVEDHDEVVARLKLTTESCTAAWASCHQSIILLLSGGLDSTIVLSCLSRAPSEPRVTCLNFVTPTVEGDEREYARQAAKHMRMELREVMVGGNAERCENAVLYERTAIPTGYTPYQHQRSVEIDLAQKVNATAVFSGQYGDSVFLEGFIEYTTADYLHHHGLNPKMFGIAYHEAHCRQLTLWSVLSQTLKFRRKLPKLTYFSDLRDRFSLLSTDARASVDPTSLQPPVLGNIDAIPRGKLIQILTCFPSLGYYDPFGDTSRPEQIHVLGSQPLVELSFRIPTYVLNANGVSRAVARKAFTDQLPTEIVNRRTKGTGTEMSRRGLADNYRELQAILLDGILMEEGIVDRKKLEASISHPDSISAPIAAELPVLLGTEKWLRRWVGATDRQAVA